MKQAVVCISVGSSNLQARKTISKVEKAIQKSCEKKYFYTAYSSSRIVKILKKQGENILSLQEVFERMKIEGIETIFLQPTHLIYGKEYENILFHIEQVKGEFQEIRCGKVLLYNQNAVIKLAKMLMNHYPKCKDHTYVFAGHGSSTEGNLCYSWLQEQFFVNYREDCKVAVITEAFEFSAISNKIKTGQVTLIPLMLAAGHHVCKDLIGENQDSLASKLQQRSIMVTSVLQGLGEWPEVQEMYCVQLQKMMSEVEEDDKN